MKKIQYVVHRIITPVKLFADNLTTANTDGPAEMNILIEPFFSSKWVSKKGGNGEGMNDKLLEVSFVLIIYCTASFF